jgi:RIO-like serine/threonine protein kinase
MELLVQSRESMRNETALMNMRHKKEEGVPVPKPISENENRIGNRMSNIRFCYSPSPEFWK